MTLVIGIDFDNTLISYDHVLMTLAVEQRLLAPGKMQSKREIRDAVRLLPEGEIHWQRLQAAAYGERIREGMLINGVEQFILKCRLQSIPVFVVSHKTRYASMGKASIDLRQAALGWMRENGFFDEKKLGLRESDIYFESTRREKVDRILQLGCTTFIDDLEETFLESSFPSGTRKILYAQGRPSQETLNVECAATWYEISALIFGES